MIKYSQREVILRMQVARWARVAKALRVVTLLLAGTSVAAWALDAPTPWCMSLAYAWGLVFGMSRTVSGWIAGWDYRSRA